MNLRWILLSTLCIGCSSQPDYWQLSAISTGSTDFDFSHLSYAAVDSISGINLDFFYADGTITSYLSTSGRRFSNEHQTSVTMAFQSETIETSMDLCEGAMKIRVPDACTSKIVLALQRGESVTITIGSTKQIFHPMQFSALFCKLDQKTNNFFDSFKGALP